VKFFSVASALVIVTLMLQGDSPKHGFDAVSVYVPAGRPVNWYQPQLISSSKLEPSC